MSTVVIPHGMSADVDNRWRFFTTQAGQAVGCDQDSELVNEITPQGPNDPKLPSNVDLANVPWPVGDFMLRIGRQDCHYRNNGQEPGRLFCPDREISCTEDSAKSRSSDKCADGYTFWHAVVYCDF